MNILFIGTSEFAVIPLKQLVENRFNIKAVITQPDKIGGRGKKIIQSPVKTAALENNLNIFQPDSINCNEVKSLIKNENIDLGIVISYGQIIKPEIFNLPKYKIINIHPSLLPKYRGPSPIQSCLLNGDKKTGVSIIEISEKTDAGDILSQQGTDISMEDDYFSLHEKLSNIGAEILINVIKNIDTLKRKIQDENSATYCRLISKEDAFILWKKPAVEIHNQIRALVKWPVAYTNFQGKILKIYKSKIIYDKYHEKPGTIIRLSKKSFGVVCGDGQLIEILKLQLQGKKILDTSTFLNGINLKTGETLN